MVVRNSLGTINFLRAHSRSEPDIFLRSDCLCAAHTIERRCPRNVAAYHQLDILRIDPNWAVPSLKPGRDTIAIDRIS